MRAVTSALRWIRLLATLTALGMLTFADAESGSWHGTWRGLDTYVTVVTRGHPLDRGGRPWWQWGNTRSDVYLFGFGKPGVDLVVDFSLQGAVPQANVFVLDASERTQVQVSADSYVLPPRTLIRASLRPKTGGWLIDGQPNFNLEGTFHEVITSGDAFGARKYNFEVNSSKLGEPASTTAVLADPVESDEVAPRFTAAVRADPSVPYQLAPALLPGFPYLSAAELYQFYGPNQPLMFETSSRELLSRFVGFQTAGVYAFNSYAPPPRVAFEAPFAWYRFDPLIGDFPNMIARVEQFPRGYTGADLPQTQRTAIRLSWTRERFRTWRYSLSVAGNTPLDQQVQVGKWSVNAIPYDELPRWTTGQPWRAVSFVEATEGLAGSEGIYAYSVEANPSLFPWLNGLADDPPDSFRAPYLKGQSVVSPYQLPSGHRGDFNLAYNKRPELYLSAVDQQVHLAYAQGGLWNLGNGYLLRLNNLNRGHSLNSWRLERVLPSEARSATPRAYTSSPVQALSVLSGHLLYSDGQGAVIQRSTPPPDQTLSMPDEAGTWRAFLSATRQPQPRNPRNLRSWLPAFSGPALTVPGGQLSGLRLTPDGFRVVLKLPRALRDVQAALPGVDQLDAGQWVLSYSRAARQWRAIRATPPAVSGTVQALQARAFQPGAVVMTLVNSGSLDLAGTAVLMAGDVPVKTWPSLTVPGQETVSRTVMWSPETAGPVRLSIRWRERAVNAPPVARGRRATPVNWKGPAIPLGQVVVAATPRVSGVAAMQLSLPQTGGGTTLPVALLLLFLLAGGYSLWRIWDRPR